MTLCSIGELALQLGVSVVTLRRWHRTGKLLPAGRTPGGHRRYDPLQARASLGLSSPASMTARKAVAYARVSSHDQKAQLLTQAERLRRYCVRQG